MMKSLSLIVGIAVAVPAAAAEKLQFNRDIRPLLTEYCFACHGPDSAARKADLRLDQRDAAIKLAAIVPGDVKKSGAIERIFSTKSDEMMPPPKAHKVMKPAEKELLKQWVAEGAEYQAHWSLIAPKRPVAPPVSNEAWVKTPIDRFVLAGLDKAKLTPAATADRRTLIRRLSLDLTGLPPTMEDADAVAADPAPNWYEKYVDKLMASPAWGEHRGRYWLDAARYADTHGIHFDNFREVWAYREWVVNAFNANKKFDQFTLEQLAGDLLPNATLDQQVASGFNRCNITTSEGGAINEEYLVLYARDRTETTSVVWLGLTAGCAVCHDHKFDPISQKDFYALSAFFNNTTQAAMDGNVHNTPPIIPIPKAEDRAKFATISKDIAALQQQAEARKKAARAEFDAWLAKVKPEELAAKLPTAGLVFQAPLDQAKGDVINLTVGGKPRPVTLKDGFVWADSPDAKLGPKAFSIQPGAAVSLPDVGDFSTKQAFSAGAWVKFPSRAQNGSIVARMQGPPDHPGWDLWYEGGKVAMHVISKWPTDALKVTTKAILNPANDWHHVFASYDGSGAPAGIKIYVDGALQQTDIANNTLKTESRSPAPFTVGQRATDSRLVNFLAQDVRVYDRAVAGPEVENLAKSTRIAKIVATAADKRTAKDKDELFAWWLLALDAKYLELTTQAAKLQQEEVAIKSRGTIAHVMHEKTDPAMAFVLNRGEYDRRKDKVTPDVPKALPPFPADLPKNRLGFAKWLLTPDHPLTARVTVNRFWQELFGNGLVRSSGDFGVTGEQPSHPELLDWLAVEFREGGWDVKKFFKTLVMSATYQQAAVTTPEKKERDPANRLLSRGPRYRMDAEMIRDHALAASGLLVQKIGGPSVKPYQPEGVWEAVAMIGSNTRDYKRDTGENLYRRSMYTFWKRAAPPASMDILNAPNRETCTVRRERTNTPLQALVTLNDPQFVEAARVLAQTILLSDKATDAAKLDLLAKRVLARPFTAKEVPVVQASLNDLLAEFKAKPDEAKKLLAFGESKADPKVDAATLAAWTMLANEVMNLDEVLNK